LSGKQLKDLIIHYASQKILPSIDIAPKKQKTNTALTRQRNSFSGTTFGAVVG